MAEPIIVALPGGGTAEFPAGTPRAEIMRALGTMVAESRQRPPSAGRALGLGVRDVVEGAAALPGAVYDFGAGIINGVTGGIDRLAGTNIPRVRSASDLVSSGLDYLGLPRAESDGERLTSAAVRGVAGVLPTMGAGAAGLVPQQAARVLAGAPTAQIAGAALGGVASEEAALSGQDPLAQAGYGLAGGIVGAGLGGAVEAGGRALRGLTMPFGQQGRERMAAEVLLRGSSQPETLPARLEAGIQDTSRRLPGAPVSTAVAARDPNLMALEQGLRTDMGAGGRPGALSPSAAIRNMDAERGLVRERAMMELADGSNPEQRGQDVRAMLDGARGAFRERVSQLFGIAEQSQAAAAPVRPILDAGRNAARLFENGGGGVPAELQGILDDLAQAGEAAGFRFLQNIRSRAGEVAGRASRDGQNRLSSAASAIVRAIDDNAGTPQWQAAVAQRRAMGEALGRDQTGASAAGAVMRTDQFGAPILEDAAAAARVIRSPASVRQVLEAGYSALDAARRARVPVEQLNTLRQQVVQARNAMRGQFIEDMIEASRGTGTLATAAGGTVPDYRPAQFARFWSQNRDVADVLFDSSRRQLAHLQRIAADFSETAMQTRSGAARGSDTAQNLSVGNLIARVTNGLVDPGNPLAQQVAAPLRLLYSAPEQATREILTRAAVDPQFAQMLLARASPSSTRRAAEYMQTNMMQRLGQAAIAGASRQAIRSATAEASLPEER